jgi:hypothetical protein
LEKRFSYSVLRHVAILLEDGQNVGAAEAALKDLGRDADPSTAYRFYGPAV